MIYRAPCVQQTERANSLMASAEQRMESISQVAESNISAAAGQSEVPLVVALDHTLVKTDTLIESCFLFAKKKPFRLLSLLFWLIRSQAQLKYRLAQEVMPDVRLLPYDREFLAYLQAQKQKGRILVLATAADEAVARRVAAEIGLFDAVYASDGVTDLSGDRKRDRLIEEFGDRGFDYAGGKSSDCSVWEAARQAVLVRPNVRVRAIVATGSEIARVFDAGTPDWRIYLHGLRPHHWFKNSLTFLPLIAAHQFYNIDRFTDALVAFAVLSVCASSVYLLNDLFDLQDDRRHPHKRQRMLASGQLPIGHAVVMVPILWSAAVLMGLFQPPFFSIIFGLYSILMLAYCLKLRDFVAWDVLALAVGYSLRVLAGASAAKVSVSAWLLLSVFCLFLGLALLKRYAELVTVRAHGQDNRVRGYPLRDVTRVAVYGRLSSFLALLLLGVYLGAGPAFLFKVRTDLGFLPAAPVLGHTHVVGSGPWKHNRRSGDLCPHGSAEPHFGHPDGGGHVGLNVNVLPASFDSRRMRRTPPRRRWALLRSLRHLDASGGAHFLGTQGAGL